MIYLSFRFLSNILNKDKEPETHNLFPLFLKDCEIVQFMEQTFGGLICVPWNDILKSSTDIL